MESLSLRLLVLLVMMVSYAAGYSYEGSCAPDCSNVPNNQPTWDPRNCRRYYMCINEVPNAVPIECPDGEVFNYMSHGCVTDTVCDPGFPHCVPECRFECHKYVSAHRKGCSKFNFCNPNGNVDEIPCDSAPNLYFDGNDCQTDIHACCDPCLVYCHEANTKVANPYDCTQFYFCNSNEYFPDDADLFSCNYGQYFDPINQVCSVDASCTQLCDSTAPTSLPPSGGCVNGMICTGYGYFPACTNRCSERYFYCSIDNIGGPAETYICPGNELMNPDTVLCVDPSDCPYPSET